MTSRYLRPSRVTLLVILLTGAAYLPAVSGEFFSDDFTYIVSNERLQSVELSEAWKIFVTLTNRYEFLPLRDLSYRIDLALFGLAPAGYHLHSIALYLACCGLVFLCSRTILDLLSRNGPADSAWSAAMLTMLFAAHPAHVESVAWISGRKDLLAGVFGFLALWLFASSLCGPAPNWKRLIPAYLCFALALAGKSTALSLVGIVVLIAWIPVARAGVGDRLGALRRWGLPVVPFALIGAAWLLAGLTVAEQTLVRDPLHTAIVQREGVPLLALTVLGGLTRIAVIPWNLRLIYDLGETDPLAYAMGGLALALGLWGLFRMAKRPSPSAFGLAGFVILCLPFLQLIPYRTWSLASERFLFFPVFALSIAVLAALRRFPRTVAVGIMLVLTLGGLTATAMQASKWGNVDRLIEDSARRAPTHYLAQQLWIEGVLLPAGEYDRALEAASAVRDRLARDQLVRAVRIEAATHSGDTAAVDRELGEIKALVSEVTHPGLLIRIAEIEEREGRYAEALQYYAKAERRGRNPAVIEQSRAGLARIRRRYAEPLETLRAAVAGAPGEVRALGELANLELQLHLLDDAVSHYRRILEIEPGLAAGWFNLGLAYSRQTRHSDAALAFQRAIDAGLATPEAWNSLGVSLKELGRWAEAEQAYLQSLELDPLHCHAVVNLGQLHLLTGEPDRARQYLRLADESACDESVRPLIRRYLD